MGFLEYRHILLWSIIYFRMNDRIIALSISVNINFDIDVTFNVVCLFFPVVLYCSVTYFCLDLLIDLSFQGIYRLSGQTSEIMYLKQKFDDG